MRNQDWTNRMVSREDLSLGGFFHLGGRVAAVRGFGAGLPALLDELNGVLGE